MMRRIENDWIAKPGHYSSVVGMAIHIEKKSGPMLGQLMFVGFGYSREECERVAREIADALNAGAIDFR